MKPRPVTLMDREVQTSDTLVYRKDLPRVGKVSAIDIGVRFTNGATVPINMDPLDIFNHISLLMNGTDYRFHMKGQDVFKYNWMKLGKPMPYKFDNTASATQTVWFRIPCGRYLGDEQFGLDLAKYQNVQVQLDYALSNFGTVGTYIITGTISFTIVLHMWPVNAPVNFQGMIGAREFWTGTSVASRNNAQMLPAQRSLYGLVVSCTEDGIADGTDVTDVEISKIDASYTWFKGKWYNFQKMLNDALDVRTILYWETFATGAAKVTQVNNIQSIATSNAVHHIK